jgi:hypothetical protein
VVLLAQDWLVHVEVVGAVALEEEEEEDEAVSQEEKLAKEEKLGK